MITLITFSSVATYSYSLKMKSDSVVSLPGMLTWKIM